MFYFQDVLTCVVWVLESVTYTCQLSTRVYTHLHDMGELKKHPDIEIEPWFSNFLKKREKTPF
jgi:hypothetical protein